MGEQPVRIVVEQVAEIQPEVVTIEQAVEQPIMQPVEQLVGQPVGQTTHSANYLPIFAGLGIATLAGIALWFAGLTPWVLIVMALAAVALALAQFTNTRVGISGALLIALGAYTVLIRFFPRTGLHLDISGGIVLALAALLSIFLLAQVARRRPLAFPNRTALIVSAVLLGCALLAAIWWIPWQTARGFGPVWAMYNDATVQMIKARPIVDLGGINTAVLRNSSPLTSALIAMAMVVGRSRVSPANMLQNDVTGAAQLWLLMAFATSVIAALITWFASAPRANKYSGNRVIDVESVNDVILRETVVESQDVAGKSSFAVRIFASALVGIIPLTWYYLGIALRWGFYNSTLALLILLCAWHIWLEARRIRAVIAVALLTLATLALLATWAPLAAIPAFLAIWVTVRGIRQGVRQGISPVRAVLPLLLALLPIGAYAFLVSLQDLINESDAGDALASEGGIQPIGVTHVLIALFISGLVVLMIAVATRSWHTFWGLFVTYVATAFLMAFLIYQRVSMGRHYWGYYPIKAIWTVLCLVFIIAVAAAIGYVVNRPIGQGGRYIGVALAVAVVGLIMWQIEPPSWRYIFAPIDVVRGVNTADASWRANLVFATSTDDQASMVIRYDEHTYVPGVGPRRLTDEFANLWLLQLLSIHGSDPIRAFAYFLNPDDDHQVCAAIRTWEQHVTVYTTDLDLEASLLNLCPDADFSVVLGSLTP